MEKKNLYLTILKNLFNKRLKLKTYLIPLGKKKRYLEKMISSAKKRGKRILESLISEYSSVCFNHDYLDLKQKTLKIYINTFYKEAKNSKSPIFLYKLTCKTTIAEKYNLNFVTEFVSKKKFVIKYGDTDFLYLICPNRYYEKYNEVFFRKKLSKKAY